MNKRESSLIYRLYNESVQNEVVYYRVKPKDEFYTGLEETKSLLCTIKEALPIVWLDWYGGEVSSVFRVSGKIITDRTETWYNEDEQTHQYAAKYSSTLIPKNDPEGGVTYTFSCPVLEPTKITEICTLDYTEMQNEGSLQKYFARKLNL